jgi:hypothetical protein
VGLFVRVREEAYSVLGVDLTTILGISVLRMQVGGRSRAQPFQISKCRYVLHLDGDCVPTTTLAEERCSGLEQER